MKAYIQHQDKTGQKLILQALVPFTFLKDCVLFTYRANVTERASDKHSQYMASIDFYQRRVDSARSNDIKSFVRNSILQERDGIQMATLFPTSMILALNTDDEEEGNMVKRVSDDECELEFKHNVFIVDGQHRMMGMIKLYDELSMLVVRTEEEDYVLKYLNEYKFNCTILVNYDLWEQGQVFVNVNFKQKPVNKSLYYEIFGAEYSENQKDWQRNKVYLAHQMVKMLNERKESPFYQRIKMLGTGDGYVSQAFFVEALMRHFKVNGLWYFDPDKKLSEAETGYFGTELLSYFVAIKQMFKAYWPEPEATKGTIICKTTGVGAWVRLMGGMRDDEDMAMLLALRDSAEKDEVCQKYVERVRVILKPLQLSAEKLFGDNSEFKSTSGQGSESKLYKKMLYYIQNPIQEASNEKEYPFNPYVLCEEIQEYAWTTPIDDLDPLGHHYEVEDISGFKINEYHATDGGYSVKVAFTIAANIYLDNEDDSVFSMEFPAECEAQVVKDGDEYQLDGGSVIIRVDTDEYYE